MSRIPISALANGVLFATQPFASPTNPSGAPVLTPGVGVTCSVFLHGTSTPASVWTTETGSTPLPQPLISDSNGAVPGWIDPATLPFDLVVALPTGAQTFVLTGAAGVTGVASAFGRSGVVTAQTGDYTAAQVGADAAGAAAAVAAASISLTQKASANGVATLDGGSQVPANQLGHVAVPIVMSFTRPGNLNVETGTQRIYFPTAKTIQSVTAIVGTAPTGASVVVDVLKNGTTIFTTQANRPTIAVSGNVSSAAVPDVAALVIGDYLTVTLAQVGSVIAGADLTVAVLVQ